MPLTREKYNKQTKTRYEAIADEAVVVDALGSLETLINKYNLNGNDLNETLKNVEISFMIGQSGKERIERAIGKRVYFLSAKKRRKAILKGFAGEGQPLDMMIIERKGETALLPWSRIYVSKHEAKRAKKNIQIYKLNKDTFAKLFAKKTFKRKNYLIEVKKGTDTFMVYQKVFRGYYRQMLDKTFTLQELKEIYQLDIEKEFQEKRKKFLLKQSKHMYN